MRKGTWRRVALWTVSVLLAALYVFAGAGKVTGSPQAVQGFASYGYPVWLMYAVGAAELLGALLLLLPRVAVAGAGLLGVVMAGAVFTHLRAGEGPMAIPAAVLLVALGLVGRARWRTRARRPAVEAAASPAQRAARHAER